MDVVLALLLGLVAGCGAGILIMLLVHKRRTGAADLIDPSALAAEHAHELGEVRTREQAVQAELRQQLASATATLTSVREQLEHTRHEHKSYVERIEAERTERLERERAEHKVLQALAPVRDSVTEMKKKVADLEQQRTQQYSQITEQLRTAHEADQMLRDTTETLASALRSNSMRGAWGETQLRSVVEAAGLLERVDFDVQTSISSDAGAGRPDMVVHLPGGKSIAVDSKVPFSAYLEASAIPATADESEQARRATLLDKHVKAMRSHISALGSKEYWNGFDASPEFVIAFIPTESLVSAALETDPTIMEFAFNKKVALASPVTLWSVLKTVSFTWQQDVLTEDAKELFDNSRELYSRLATMAAHIAKLGSSITSSVNHYNAFVGSLERSVLPSARRLNSLDESKVLPNLKSVEDQARVLTAPELTAQELAAQDSDSGGSDSAAATTD